MKEIKTTTNYTEERVGRFLKFYYFDKLKIIRIVLNIFIVIAVINFFTRDVKRIVDVIAFIFSLFGILELNTGIVPKFNLFKLKRKKDSILNSKVSYVFKKNNFKLTTDKDEFVDYNTLLKVIETKTDYYLYINNSRSLIVGKDSLSKDEITMLSERLKNNVSTYIIKNV